MKIYLFLLMVLIPIASPAASKCLTEIGSFCPSNVEQIACLRANLAKFSPKCTEAIKVMIASAQPEKKLCDEDIAKFCAADKDDPKKLETCLNMNLQMLSAECQKSGEFVVAKSKEALPQATVSAANPVSTVKPEAPVPPAGVPPESQKDKTPVDPCENDLKTLCPGMKASEQLNCLQSQLERVNPECSSMIGNMLGMKTNPEKAKTACKLDAEKFCPSETGDKEKRAACMKANEANLSAECKSSGEWLE